MADVAGEKILKGVELIWQIPLLLIYDRQILTLAKDWN